MMRRRIPLFWIELGLVVCLTWGIAPTLVEGQEHCCSPDSPYGSSEDELVIPLGGYHSLPAHMDYRNVTNGAGATLDTRGHRLRVCGTLLNYGTIENRSCGGNGKVGGFCLDQVACKGTIAT